jgi:SET domain-containing protein
MPPLSGLRVVLSGIHGYGVVALRTFRAGDLITYGDGVVFTEDQEFDDEYALVLNNPRGEDLPSVYYDLADQTRWINHSCDPNSSVHSSWDEVAGIFTTWWQALRDIAPGEEITYDYAFAGHLAVPCNCGTAKCRGLIVDLDELDEIPAEMRPYLRRPHAA